MFWIGVLIGCVVAGPIGFGAFALFVISAENKEIRRLRTALAMQDNLQEWCDELLQEQSK